MTTTQFRLGAIAGLEYKFNTGWRMADTVENVSELFDTEEEARNAKDAFVQSLNVSQDEVFEIYFSKITTGTDEDGEEVDEEEIMDTIDFIDNSEKGFWYMLIREYGQYQLGKNKYKIEYTSSRDITRNEYLLRIENGSFHWNVEELFKTEDEVRSYIAANPDLNIVASVVDGVVKEDSE